jgi:hypothetical protein
MRGAREENASNISQDDKNKKKETSPSASARFSRTGAFCFSRPAKKPVSRNGTFARFRAYPRVPEERAMLVERGLRVMNAEVVGDAYAIASNYLRRTGAIADSFVTNERLLEIIVEMFQRGEMNRLRLANKAITKFETAELV